MKLDKVMDELALVMSELTDVNWHEWPAASITPPAGYVSYPLRIEYDQTYGRGEDSFVDLPLVLLAGDPTARETRDTVARWAGGDGADSLKRAFTYRRRQRLWVSCDDVQLTTGEFDVEIIAGVPYLAVLFKATVTGTGEA